jgi:hypothetical protein|tara:strand:+ start:227 stop:439 length:213 start_codon:yes stop_codon:yes gene_type:complete
MSEPTEKMSEPTELYNIYFDYEDGKPPQYLGTTNNLDKWLEDNNSLREGEGNEPECLDDFEIEEAELYIY